MLQRAVETKQTIVAFMLVHDEECSEFTLDASDWRTITTTIEFLTPFAEITQSTEGDDVTLDKFLMHMDFLRFHYTKSSNKHVNNTSLLSAITNSWYAFDKWYSATDSTPVYAAAVLLHPRRRLAYFNKAWKEEWITPALAAVRDLWIRRYKDKVVRDVIAVTTPSRATEPSEKEL